MYLGGSAQLPYPNVPFDVTLYGDPSPGYFFLTPHSRYSSESYPGCLVILDSAGNDVFYAPLPVNSSVPFINTRPFDFRVHYDGTFSYASTEGPSGYEFYFLDQNLDRLETFSCDSLRIDEHDMVVTEDGHRHYICKKFQFLDATNITFADGTQGFPNTNVLTNPIIEVDAQGNQVNYWNPLDHIPLEDTQIDFLIFNGFIDHVHTNSIAFDLDSNYILSQRNVSEVQKINRQTGDVMWRFGGAGNQFQLVGDTALFDAQHYAQIAPNGNLYLFDNGRHGEPGIARYLEYVMDTAAWTATLVREIQHPNLQSSAIMGSAHLLSDDHVVISWGGFTADQHPANVSEYDAQNNVVLEIDYPFDYQSYRAHKQDLPFELVRPEVVCDNGTKTLNAPAGFDVYEWSTGDTSASIVVDTPGTYYVWVNHGIGYLRSEAVVVSDMDDICLPTFVPPVNEEGINAFPNPLQDLMILTVPTNFVDGWEMLISDPRGKVLRRNSYTGSNQAQIDVADFAPGIYIVRAWSGETAFTGKVVKYLR